MKESKIHLNLKIKQLAVIIVKINKEYLISKKYLIRANKNDICNNNLAKIKNINI